MKYNLQILLLLFISAGILGCDFENDSSSTEPDVNLIPVDHGWAQSSVNTVVFRINSIDSFDDFQAISYYDNEGAVKLATRYHDETDWQIHSTPFTGDVTNAHNAISIGFDGDGKLHMVWGLHNAPMQYVTADQPQDSLTFSDPEPMTGEFEESVTYPQFFRLPDGDLLFMYREGGSGQGSIMLNRYHLSEERWSTLQHPIIDGGGDLSPYPNPIAIDNNGGWHLSWNWRETPDVASNHNLAYAYSPDEGETWLTSAGDEYELPIRADNADIVTEIPQNSELINQTTMTVDSDGNPVIATYWRADDGDVPQYHVIRRDGESGEWITHQVTERTLDFSLSGYGTRRIPIARPLAITTEDNRIIMIFRDFERGGGVSASIGEPPNYSDWNIIDLDTTSVGLWEPTHDPTIWKEEQVLHLFHQHVGQGEAETLEDIPAQQISILEWKP